MLSTLLNRPCTILRRSGTAEALDEYGNEIQSEELIDTVCELQQRQRTEQDAQGELADTGWLLILPPSTAIRTGDAVVVDGAVYEMVGDPWPARNPRTQQQSHVEASVRRTVGDDEVGS